MSIESSVFQVVSQFFSPDEYPCLHHQLQEFSSEKPLSGTEVLYAAPLTRNTLVALLPVFAGGALVTLSWPDIIEPDVKVQSLMEKLGVPCLDKVPRDKTFDLIFDCCGKYSNHTAKFGHIELTRSGLDKYRALTDVVCLDVDSTLIKNFETMLGTGESLARALKQAGYKDLAGKQILLFGYGKVGQGICRALLAEGALVHIVEVQTGLQLPKGVGYVNSENVDAVVAEVKQADFIVTATGVQGVIQHNYPIHEFINSPAKLINMGGEDEYGEDFPVGEVLNGKCTFNFILDDPTLMKFIDPIFALYNECGALLVQEGRSEKGVHLPPDRLVMPLAERFCEANDLDINDWV